MATKNEIGPGGEKPRAGDTDDTLERAGAPTTQSMGDTRFIIVALGASAGGLDALEQFFEHMPSDSGMGFVVVTHQHPDQLSMMAELLGRKTEMSVRQVSESTRVQPNHVYTVEPGYDLAILGGVLQPMRGTQPRLTHMPIDYFFSSLAHDQKECAVAVVLSGTGSDGSVGLREIKGQLGMVMVQAEQSAQYGGMPHSAIATELVDYVLPAPDMPETLIRYVEGLLPGRPHPGARVAPEFEALQQIFVLVRDRTGHQFSQYKQSTIGRRIERRMNVHRLDGVRRYVRYLQNNPGEVDALFKELLIGVTSFFRDPEAWEALSEALPALLQGKPDDYEVRAWVPGCSTGEEAYSLAIMFREIMDDQKRPLSVQVFATDLDQSSIDVARLGLYPPGIANNVSPERLARFFTREDDSYRIRKDVREMLVFAAQNLITDPPFTKLDLLCCRNLLIYLDTPLQRRLVPMFHYALRQQGLLFLGTSESIGTFVDLFSAVDMKAKIFRRSDVPPGTYVAELPAGRPDSNRRGRTPTSGTGRVRAGDRLEQVVDRMLLEDMVPATVLVHECGDVVHVHGHTGLFLEPAQGSQSTANLFNMVRPGMQLSLASAIRQAAATDDEIVHSAVRVKANGGTVAVDLRVLRLQKPESLRGLFRVSFVPVPVASSHEGGGIGVATAPPERVSELERELQYAKESHEGTSKSLETANEELKSTNEELQSANEELQSANEELETSKEEMQSLNEELQTVNAELQAKVDELSLANNDMKNLLNATDIATVFLDSELRIKRYTEQAKRVIRLIPTDVGRPIGDLVSTLCYDHLVDDAHEVRKSLVSKETEVGGKAGESYLMRILPYRTTDNVIEGLVLTFVDVSKVRNLQQEQARLLDVLRHSPAVVFEQDQDLRYVWSFGAAFGKGAKGLVGKSDNELFPKAEADALVKLKSELLRDGVARRRRVELTVDGERRQYQLHLEARRDEAGELTGLTCVATDITVLE